jgi:hypothetical protein
MTKKPTVRCPKSRSSALPMAARAEMIDVSSADRGTGAPAVPTQDHLKPALDGAFAEQFKVLFPQLYNGLTIGLPNPDQKAAADRFATNSQRARGV